MTSPTPTLPPHRTMGAAEQLRRIAEALPEGGAVTFTRADLLAMASEPQQTFDGIGTNEASEITGVEPRKLRRLHRQWERATELGHRPPIRVSRKSASDRSDLLFDRSDCYRYRREHGGGPRVVNVAATDPDDLDELADAMVDNLLAEG